MSIGLTAVCACEKARTKAMGILTAVRNGGDPAATRDADRTAITVKELSVRFDREHIALRLKEGTAKEYRRNLRRFIVPARPARGRAAVKQV